MSSQDFRDAIAKHLDERGINREVATRIAALLDEFLTFKLRPDPSPAFDAYVCFAFGNEPDEFANLHPGKVNQELASIVKCMYTRTRKPIIAQWEIGELLKKDPDIGSADIESYGQNFCKVLGKPVYQSTRSFLDKVALDCEKKSIKRLLVVAQWFHYARCVNEIKRVKLEPVVDQEAMPKSFCTENFGQLWTSSEERHVLHTLISLLTKHREEQNKKWKEGVCGH